MYIMCIRGKRETESHKHTISAKSYAIKQTSREKMKKEEKQRKNCASNHGRRKELEKVKVAGEKY